MLRQRVVTAALSLIPLLGVLLWGDLPWRLLVWAGTVVGASEFCGMLGFRWRSLVAVWAYALVTLVQWWPRWHSLIGIQILVASALVWPVVLRNRVSLPQSATVLVGSLYVGYGGAAVVAMRSLPQGVMWVLLFLVSIWMTDTVAYFAGSWLKGPKLWPDISPKKTISGAVAGGVGAAAGALAVGLAGLPGGRWWAYAVLGVVISLAGQLGDLVESAYKRSAGVKDSGKLLTGHGGILDRVDSLLFAAPFAHYLIAVGLASWFR
ncbi:MAG: phosphatidate cytidylyltransferase [Alicyclobacillus sp.]|nr:phosphatidate cytidylyltransferase [Alicyclobacillus sp.]